MSVENVTSDPSSGALDQIHSNVSSAIGRLDAVLEQDVSLALTEQMEEIFSGEAFQQTIASAVAEMFAAKGSSLLENAMMSYLSGGEEGESPLHTAIAAYFNKGEKDETSPMETIFASYYNKYLYGDGEEVVGMIPTYNQLVEGSDTIIGLKPAYHMMVYGSGAEGETAGILSIGEQTISTIEKSVHSVGGVVEQIENAKGTALQQIKTSTDQALVLIEQTAERIILSKIDKIASIVAGMIGVSRFSGADNASIHRPARD